MISIDALLVALDVAQPVRFLLRPILNSSLRAEDYRLRGCSREKAPPEGILMNTEQTPYGAVLSVAYKGDRKDVALGGFSVDNATLDVLQLQGRCGSYRELRPINWSRILLKSIVDAAQVVEAEIVRVIPSKNISYDDPESPGRYEKTYDSTSAELGFRYSASEDMFVKELKRSRCT